MGNHMTILVTGATGLLGSNVVTQLLEKGKKVRAIVRNPAASDAEQIRKLGAEVVPGQVSDMSNVATAARGVEGIIHYAAMLGRIGSSIQQGFSTNVLGSINIYTAAVIEGNVPVVQVITGTFFDATKTLTEASSIDLMFRSTDPYSVTKRLGFAE